jgi:uncharacterized protein (TIGR02594 family)
MSNYPWYDEARKELGIREGRDDAEILKLFREAGHPEIDGSDTAWCAAFAGAMLQRAGYKPSGSLMARSYVGYGMQLGNPKVGCIAVLWRGSPHSSEGHVGFVNSFDDDTVALVGGNQGSSGVVSIECFPRSRVLCFRWPDDGARRAGGGAEAGAKTGSESEKPLQNNTASAGPNGAEAGRKRPDLQISTNSAPPLKTKGATSMNPLSILTSVITAVFPKDAPGTPAAGITTPIGTARSSLMSIVIGALLAGVGSTGVGVDAMHTISTFAGGALVLLSAVNHLGLIGANNANTEAYAEYLLKKIADAAPTPPTAPTA